MSTHPNYNAIAEQRYKALVASCAQTWREVSDSPRAVAIFNFIFDEPDIATWEGEGGHCA